MRSLDTLTASGSGGTTLRSGDVPHLHVIPSATPPPASLDAASERARPAWVGKLLYGTMFVVVLPIALVAWAHGVGSNVALPAVRSWPLGGAALAGGGILIGWGMLSLVVHGGGLPMNAYPPPRLATRGAYRLLAHPIYVGFGLACIGGSLVAGSASGLWLVSPLVLLGMTALVLGYERIDLRARFGSELPRPLIGLPPADDARPALRERTGVGLLVLVPWVVVYEWLQALGTPSDAIVTFLRFERDWPVLPWTTPVYSSTYLLVVLALLVAPTRRDLREFGIRGAIATLAMPLLFTALPFVAPPRPFDAGAAGAGLLALERQLDTPANAFPSYHVLWAFLAMAVFARWTPRLRALWWLVAVAVVASTVTTGMHGVVDVTAGAVGALAVLRWRSIWEFLRRSSERVANSWREWDFGAVRAINHGVYAGIGAGLSLFIAGLLVGWRGLGALALVGLTSLAGAGLWAQLVEGSPALLRPFGYYGGVAGILAGSILFGLVLDTDPWLLLAVCSVAGPWVQSWGRLRCLVQGCCHGHEAPGWVGIVYRHPRNRVCRLSPFGGMPIHPTQLYSILWNVVIASTLTRLWSAAAPLSLIAGLYLLLSGLGRFVEEAYRGEPQTHVLRGLRLYQWIAVVTVLGGAAVTCVPSAAAPAGLHFSWVLVLASACFGVVTTVAMGVDFPRSNRRFARLV